MCGRTACTLHRQALTKQCAYKNSRGDVVEPGWRDDPGGHEYQPSYNKPPGTYCPVLISAKHSNSALSCEDRILQPMHWGLVPSWSKTGTSEFNMSNCRFETMLSKTSFKRPLQKGCRCVIVADGFYEWKRPKSGRKQPYFIHLPTEGPGCTGHRLLSMAGLFDVNEMSKTEPVFSFSVITMDSAPPVNQIHDRMPAILDGDEEINMWLDYGHFSLDKAVSIIKPYAHLQMHPVSTEVNNSRNNSEECVKSIEKCEVDSHSGSVGISKYLIKSPMKSIGKPVRESPVKRLSSPGVLKKSVKTGSSSNPLLKWLKSDK